MRIELPDSWQEKPATGIFDGAAYVALGPAGYRDYAPSVVVLRVEDMQDSLGRWTSRSRNDIPSDIATYRLLDTGELTLAGNPATVSMTVLSISGVSVTQTQVLTITPRGDGYQITASCATPDYPKLVDLLHGIIATFDPEEEPLGADEEPATAYVHSFPGRRLPSSWRQQRQAAEPAAAPRIAPSSTPAGDQDSHNVAAASGPAADPGVAAPPEQSEMRREEPGAAPGRTATPGEDA